MSLRLISSGVLTCGTCVGGTCVYQYAVPKTWREILTKEGFLFLEEEEEYKAVWADNKEEIIEKIKETYPKLKEATDETTAVTSIKAWCQEQLDKYPTFSEWGTKKYVANLCTQSGILNIHGMLLYSKKTGFLSYDGNSDDSKYKNIFAVYKYNSTFLTWLNEGQTEKLTQTSKASDKFEVLKKKCKTILTTKRETEIKSEVYKYATWWCIGLKHETVRERIKNKHTGWEQETDGEKIKEKWKYTDEVKEKAKKKNEVINDPEAEDYKNWCDEKLSKQLYEEDIYKDTYLAVMSACRVIPKTKKD